MKKAMAQKWDPFKRQYEPYVLPGGATLLANLEAIISCANCGSNVEYGNCYTSRFIHNVYGLGYAVCPKCYGQELLKESEALTGGKEH